MDFDAEALGMAEFEAFFSQPFFEFIGHPFFMIGFLLFVVLFYPHINEHLIVRPFRELMDERERKRMEGEMAEEGEIEMVPVNPTPWEERPILDRIPRRFSYVRLPHPPQANSPFTVPLGYSTEGLQWLDLGRDALHVGLYAASGAGKDNLLRCWFLSLTLRNRPERVQFCIIDGKGDWLTPNLAVLSHMFMPPAGGYGKAGDQRILEAIQAIDAEAERRQEVITNANCRTREQYIQQTGRAMPLLVVIATDVMTTVAGKVETLLVNLVSKARSLGIRAIISMQTPTGRDTRWRMNLSTVVAGMLQSGSQDGPALGIDVKEMLCRPSQLPHPQERPGVFVVRSGVRQVLVQAPYLADAEFDDIVGRLPTVPGTVPGGNGGGKRPNATFGLSDGTFGVRSHAGERSEGGETSENCSPADPNANVAITPVELVRVVQAVQAYQGGMTKERAITDAFGCRKGSSKAYQRASLLFDMATGKAA